MNPDLDYRLIVLYLRSPNRWNPGSKNIEYGSLLQQRYLYKRPGGATDCNPIPFVRLLFLHTHIPCFTRYLPPPVLDILSNHQLEAAKRAAMITTALKWLIGHLPVKLMPPQLRPAMFFLQRLIPFLGYIGGFVAWSWGAIKGYDKGS